MRFLPIVVSWTVFLSWCIARWEWREKKNVNIAGARGTYLYIFFSFSLCHLPLMPDRKCLFFDPLFISSRQWATRHVFDLRLVPIIAFWKNTSTNEQRLYPLGLTPNTSHAFDAIIQPAEKGRPLLDVVRPCLQSADTQWLGVSTF